MANEKLFLVPGCTVGKKGLPGGKIECKKGQDPLELNEKVLKVLEKNLPYLKSTGKILTLSQVEKLLEKAGDDKKSEKRLNLEAEATDLEIEFDDKTTQKELVLAIEEKKAELLSDGSAAGEDE